MNDNAIKNYAIWARRELMSEVEKRCAWWGISEDAQADVESIDGRVLSAQERKQRADLLRIVKADGFGQLVEKAAYTWFNRLLAIRFMEVNDRLPSHVRMLSSASGEFEPQCLREALDLPLDALDKDEAVKLVQAGDDEALFRLVFLAQCAELAECMPAVFEKVGSAMELLLPTGLLRRDGVVGQLVEQIPEDDWREGVEIVGWMYQYYVSERKDEVFASFKKGKKAERDAIAPATQLFTPHWIVRYLTENSLGRLWMLNHPDSKLVEKMPYFIKPDEEHETEFRRISSPEEITCVDPACGSGHILVYAFELLAAMYEEAGYSNRDAARLIVEKNITGLEIDPRAAAMASFALTMKACELDSRFLRRGVVPKITVLERIEFEPDELTLCPNLAERTALHDAVAHLDECGSLLQPEHDDLAAIERDLASLASEDSLFVDSAREKLGLLLKELQPLTARYDVVVANPPYMGSSSLGSWMSAWVKKKYPDEKSDLCTSFIERGFTLSRDDGANAMITMQSWMFLGSYEKMRGKLLRNHSISSMAHLGTRAFGAIAGEVVSTTATVFSNRPVDECGAYFRLVDMGGEDEKQEGYLEALADSDCGWFYRRSSEEFATIPGMPVVYWASRAVYDCFARQKPLSAFAELHAGARTGENERFIRFWWEISNESFYTYAIDPEGAKASNAKWFPCNKGGGYRRWYGNNYYAIDWENDGERIRNHPGSDVSPSRKITWFFTDALTWGSISSGDFSMRSSGTGFVFTDKGPGLIVKSGSITLEYVLALMNSSVVGALQRMLSPTLDYHEGQLGKTPTIITGNSQRIEIVSASCIALSRDDWNANEVSWCHNRHPLI